MSVFKLYNCKISADRNALVDNIQDYLGTLTPVVSNNSFHYQKIELDTNIKLELEQSKVGSCVGNYIDIFQDSKHFYFFVIGSKWTAPNTVELRCSLDTINTFAGDFTFNKKTKISRQHKDRFIFKQVYEHVNLYDSSSKTPDLVNFVWTWDSLAGLWRGEYTYTLPNNNPEDLEFSVGVRGVGVDDEGIYWQELSGGNVKITAWGAAGLSENDPAPVVNEVVINFGYKYPVDGYFDIFRKIDTRSEGATPVLFHNISEDQEITDSDSSLDWYLIYKSQADGENQPVDCFLCPRESIKYKVATNSISITPADLDSNYYYYLPAETEWYDENDVRYVVNRDHSFWETGQNTNIVLKKTSPTEMTIYETQWQKWNGVGELDYTYYFKTLNTTAGITQITLSVKQDSVIVKKDLRLQAPQGDIHYFPVDAVDVTFTAGSITTQTVNNIYQLDRTDSKLIKVIKLPYCPTGYSVDSSNILTFDSPIWDFDTSSKYFKLTSTNEKFLNSFIPEENPLSVLYIANMLPSLSDLRNDDNESKLYHSDFYVPKVVYDSFGLGLQLEKVDLDKADLDNFTVDFIPTTTINSKFLFRFPGYVLNNATEDYPNVFTVGRNNEIPIYNSAYINYIKTGYNYDIKNKERSNISNWVSTGIQLAAGIASIAAGFATGGVSAALGIGLISSAVGGIANNINSNIANETGIQQKLEQYKNQAASVSGSDDVDLMSIYTNNKCKLINYKVSNAIRQDFADLFYYCGYSDNSQEVPNITSRSWFNFLQCEPVFNEEANTPYQDFLKDIKERYKLGVTVYHKTNDSWDWDQVKENWESSVFE